MWKKFGVVALASMALPVVIALPVVAAESGHRQHDAHVHGVGRADVALDGNRLMLELSIPAHDLVGFEHAPATEQEHKTLEAAVARLRDGLSLFVPNPEAQCSQTQVDVKSALLEADQHDEDHHEAHQDDHHDHDADHGEDEETHADFTLFYRFECRDGKQLKQLRFEIFQDFSGVSRLSVQFIGPAGQQGMKATPQQAVLNLQ
ncbi:MAG: zinc-binding protein [Pseudomonadales bacterium]|nr:zinc-binding protein [Pseudomonadales bacterium]